MSFPKKQAQMATMSLGLFLASFCKRGKRRLVCDGIGYSALLFICKVHFRNSCYAVALDKYDNHQPKRQKHIEPAHAREKRERTQTAKMGRLACIASPVSVAHLIVLFQMLVPNQRNGSLTKPNQTKPNQTNQPTNQATHQTKTNQPTDQPTNQPIQC